MEPGEDSPAAQRAGHGVTFAEALRVWVKVAALSFGGPTGQIAVMHRLLVDQKRWISEGRFLHALNYCMLLPGPEAQQLATYIGWLLHGLKGGLAAGILFVLPGAAAILALSIVYAEYQETGFVQALFYGLKPAVLAVVVEAVLRIGKRVLRNGAMLAIAASAFVAIFFFAVPFPLVISGAALVGYVGGRWREDLYYVLKPKQAGAVAGSHDSAFAITDHVASAAHTQVTWLGTVRTVAVWLAVWLVPLGGLVWRLGPDHVLVREGVFFSKAATVTFGGAYSVLGYVKQQAVEKEGWLTAGEMLDGLGMAETTPGPLIMVTQFVGFLGAYRDPAPFSPLVAGIAGSLVTTWVTFAPCFLWIFAGAPYIEKLRGNKSLSTALSAITAAVVGVVLNLAVWFAWQTLLHSAGSSAIGAIGAIGMVPVSENHSLDLAAGILAVAAGVALLRYHTNLIATLAASAAIGLAYSLLFRG